MLAMQCWDDQHSFAADWGQTDIYSCAGAEQPAEPGAAPNRASAAAATPGAPGCDGAPGDISGAVLCSLVAAETQL